MLWRIIAIIRPLHLMKGEEALVRLPRPGHGAILETGCYPHQAVQDDVTSCVRLRLRRRLASAIPSNKWGQWVLQRICAACWVSVSDEWSVTRPFWALFHSIQKKIYYIPSVRLVVHRGMNYAEFRRERNGREREEIALGEVVNISRWWRINFSVRLSQLIKPFPIYLSPSVSCD